MAPRFDTFDITSDYSFLEPVITALNYRDAHSGITRQLQGMAYTPKSGNYFVGFNLGVSNKGLKRMRLVVRRWNINLKSSKTLADFAPIHRENEALRKKIFSFLVS